MHERPPPCLSHRAGHPAASYILPLSAERQEKLARTGPEVHLRCKRPTRRAGRHFSPPARCALVQRHPADQLTIAFDTALANDPPTSWIETFTVNVPACEYLWVPRTLHWPLPV